MVKTVIDRKTTKFECLKKHDKTKKQIKQEVNNYERD